MISHVLQGLIVHWLIFVSARIVGMIGAAWLIGLA
jgi:hypothetical protein